MDNEDEALVSDLRLLGQPAIQELHGLLTGPPERMDRVLQQLAGKPQYADLAQFLAMAATDKVIFRLTGTPWRLGNLGGVMPPSWDWCPPREAVVGRSATQWQRRG